MSGGPYIQNPLSVVDGFAPVVLCDIEAWDGSVYYWATVAGTYPARIGGGDGAYVAKVKSAGPFRLSRSLSTDAGNLVLENMSGPAYQRDTRSLLGLHEFEGALCIVRYWSLTRRVADFEFHGFLSETESDEMEGQFRVLQLLDGSTIDVPGDTYSDKCTLRYKGPLCGSTSLNASCDRTFDVCTSKPRFNGCPNPPPLTVYPPVTPTPNQNPPARLPGWMDPHNKTRYI